MNTRFTSRILRFALGFGLLFGLMAEDVRPVSAALRCYVKASAGGSNTGGSWANAYKSLQSALGISPCTEVWVADGLYKPTTGTERTASFRLKKGVALYGGFAGNETLLSQRNIAANPTVLSGNIVAAGIADNSYHVVTGIGTDSTARLDGFIITGGNADGTSPYDSGGGMYNSGGSPSLANLTFNGNSATNNGGGMANTSGSSPSLTRVSFTGNSASKDGGGMHNSSSSSPILTNVIFSNNSANLGGAMANDASSPNLVNVIFSGNSAANSGGGIYNTSSSPSLRNVTFSSNSVPGIGGGMYNISSSPSLVNVTFSSNSANFGGGAILDDTSSPSLTNVTFSDNSAPIAAGMYNSDSSPTLVNVTFSGNSANNAGAIYNTGSSPTITNSIFYGDTGGEIVNNPGSASVNHSIVQGGYPGTGNLNVNPLLKPLGNYGGFVKTRPLALGSPAIDRGANSGCPLKDARGVARPQDGDWNGAALCDMGATESRSVTISLRSTGAQDGWVLESAEDSNMGGTKDAVAETLSVGDGEADKQGLSILSFNTAVLPDSARITAAALKVKQAGQGGSNPFNTLGNLLVDVRKGAFSGNPALQLTDFQATASKSSVMIILNNPVNGWYSQKMASVNLIYINKTGLTQFRLRFQLDDNDNGNADYLKFHSGDSTTIARPQLIVKYYLS